LLVVDRKPWRLQLYRNDGIALALIGDCVPAKPKQLDSKVIPFRFSLAAGRPRPNLVATCRIDGQTTRI
jgi:hypothetical protein